MSGFRYRSYVDGPDPLRPPFDVRSAVDALGRAVLAGASPTRALRDLLRRGTRGVRGLDELLRHVRERKEQLRSQGRLDGTLAQARRLLDQAVGQERAVLFPDPSDEARLRERELDDLPADPAAAIRRLAGYQWRSSDARQTFTQLQELLRREILDAQFRGMRQAMARGTPEELQRVRAMLDALHRMLDADDRGEHTQADFERFMAEFGDFFPDRPRTLDELVDVLARRSAAMQRLFDSLTPEQRAELLALSAQVMRDAGLADAVQRLGERLRARRPDLVWSGGVAVDGDAELGLGDATTAVAELADLAELEEALGQGYAGARLDDIDTAALQRVLGRSAAEDVARLRALERELRDRGYLSGSRDRVQLTPKAVRALGEVALRDVLSGAGRRPGTHDTREGGPAGELTGASRPWRFGDEQPLDAVRTAINAVRRGASSEGRLRLRPEDMEVAETERRDAAAVCLLVDLSYSMVQRGLWGVAKQTALALHTLVSTRFPQDAVHVIGFNDHARVLAPRELAELSPEPVQGTNLHHALLLAGRHVDRHPEFEPVVLVVTDGEPTAHLEEDGLPYFSYPPSPRTTELTLAEVDRMTRRGARMTVFSLADDPRLEEFVTALVARNGGRALRPVADQLGSFVVRDLLAQRSRW